MFYLKTLVLNKCFIFEVTCVNSEFKKYRIETKLSTFMVQIKCLKWSLVKCWLLIGCLGSMLKQSKPVQTGCNRMALNRFRSDGTNSTICRLLIGHWNWPMTFSGMFRSYLHVILLLLASGFGPSRFPRPTTDCTSSSTVGYGLVRSATALEIDLNVSKTHQATCFGANWMLDRFKIF